MEQMNCMQRGEEENLRKFRSVEKKTAIFNKLLSISKLLFFPLIFFLFSETIYSQELTIKGIVVDEHNEPLIGASVKLVNGKEKVGNLSLGTVTNLDGQYTIKVPSANFSLEFSYIGYETKVIPLTDTRLLERVILKESGTELQEVVITGYTKIDKRLFTGASDRLSADEIKLDGIPDISRSLEGRSAGVSVQNVSGTFGTAPKIRVRGATSIYGNSTPLWVVDGVIIEPITNVDADALSSGDAETLLSSAVAGLNPSDIASWDILKDGSATSIYGAKAMAGVIVITTKRGKTGTNSISYSGEYTSRMIPSYAEFNIMNSQEQMSIYQEMEQKGWLNFSSVIRRRDSGVYGKMYNLMRTYDPQKGTFALLNTESARNAYLREAEMRNTDWFQELFQTAISHNHSVSLSGGNDKSTYYGSVSALFDPGWYKASENKRYTANMSLEHKIYSNLKLEVGSNASYRKQKAPGTIAQEQDVVYGTVNRSFDINPYSYALNTSRTLEPNEFYTRNYAPFNIIDELENNTMDINVMDFMLRGKLTWTVIKGLDLELLAATQYRNSSTEHHIKDESNQAQAYRAMPDATVRDNNTYLYKDPDNPYALPITVLPYGGIYYRRDNRSLGYNYRASVNWATAFNDIHIVNFFAGAEATDAVRDQSWFRGWGRQYSMGDVPLYAYEVFKKGQEENAKYFETTLYNERTLAFFSMLNYSYKGKYNMNASARYEGSNRLGKSRRARWLPTWSLGLAWNIHEENMFEYLKPVLSHATLRTSYSLTADKGSGATNSAIVIKAYTPWRPYISSQETALDLDKLENSELTYEKKHEFNIGADLGFLNNRINLNIDAYSRNNFDLLGDIRVAGVGGEVTKRANVAAMKSKGIEATLTTKNIITKDFRWTTTAIFAKMHEEITVLETDRRVWDLITGNGFGMVGYSHRSLFSIPFVRLNEDGLPIFINEKGEESPRVYFQERENLDFLKYEGPSEPTLFGSLGNIFNYKNFRLNVFVSYSFGNKIRLNPYFRSNYTDLNAMPREFKNRWVLPGDEAYTNIPVIASYRQNDRNGDLRYAYNTYNYSTARVADGGFVRLKEVSLAYDFPKKWITRFGMNNIALKLQATNLLLLYADSKLNGQDPEFYNSGGVASPVPRQFTCTLIVGL